MYGNKKGLINSLFVVVLLLFVFAFASLMSITVWEQFNSSIQGLDSSVASDSTKANIDDLGEYIYWVDDLFSFLLIVLILGLIITSFTLPVESYWLLIVYFGILLGMTFLSMFLSNTWTVIGEMPALASSIGSLTFTDFVLRTYPYIVFFTGLLSGLIFYLRAKDNGGMSSGFGGGGSEF